MEISAAFKESALTPGKAFWEKLLLLPLKIKINGHNWDKETTFSITESIIDFIDEVSEEDWIELDFLNFSTYVSIQPEEKIVVLPIFYPDQDLTYKNRRPKTLAVMKHVFGLFNPIVVLSANENDLVIAFRDGVAEGFDTSFLILDEKLLTMSEAKSRPWDTNLHNVERLSEHTIWINGPLGLGDETFHLTEPRYSLPGERFSQSAEFRELQDASEKHRLALRSVMKSISWNFPF